MQLDNENTKELQTIGDFTRFAASCFYNTDMFFGHGNDNALDEAYQLVTACLHLPHDIPTYMVNCRLIASEKKAVLDLIHRRLDTRQPLSYLINQAWFAGLPFYVDERVLIPRSPIAELVEARFEPWVDSEDVTDILDLCTGSGCIAIACAMEFPGAQCIGTDISNNALDVAKINVKKHGVESQVSLLCSDVYAALDASQTFDIIVSNPPYVDAAIMQTLPKEYLHEPRTALAAGIDGLDIVKRILRQASEYLKDTGILVVEVGNSRAALIDQYPEVPFTWIDFERGGDGVFILTRSQLMEHSIRLES